MFHRLQTRRPAELELLVERVRRGRFGRIVLTTPLTDVGWFALLDFGSQASRQRSRPRDYRLAAAPDERGLWVYVPKRSFEPSRPDLRPFLAPRVVRRPLLAGDDRCPGTPRQPPVAPLYVPPKSASGVRSRIFRSTRAERCSTYQTSSSIRSCPRQRRAAVDLRPPGQPGRTSSRLRCRCVYVSTW